MTSEETPPTERDDSTADLPDGGAGGGTDATTTSAAGLPPIPKRIGSYSIKSVIASGGMGTVYLAVQEHPRRRVALKVMKRGIASKSALRRFEYESQTLARLRHPNIAPVYESGTHDDGEGGVPFFAMEYVPNARTIIEHAREKKLGTRQRLALFAKVCDAIHHGHQKGIIHRDLKPGNILVDAEGEPKIIDFGVARSTDSDMAVTTLQTDIGQLVGTLQYMSPEQCDADPHDLDTRSDVYALGVVLYELLTENLPYDISRVAMFEAGRVIREEAPARPSSFDRTLRGDVETIALKALEKERSRRYQSASDLGQDIGRYLKDEPIDARPPSLLYQVRMFARRNRAVFAAAASITIVLALATLVSATLAIYANTKRIEAESVQDSLRSALSDAYRSRAGEAAEAERRRVAEDQVRGRGIEDEWQSYLLSIAAANAALDRSDPEALSRQLAAAPEPRRNWEWRYLLEQSDQSLSSMSVLGGRILAVRDSADGWRAVSIRGVKIYVWLVQYGVILSSFRGVPSTLTEAYSPDGALLAIDTYHGIQLLDAADGTVLGELPHEGEFVTSVAFSQDGARLVAASNSHDRTPAGHAFQISQGPPTIRIWDVATSEVIMTLRGHEERVHSVAFSPDGTRLASGSTDNTVRLWDTSTGEEILTLRGHESLISSVAFSPDGTRLASGSSDNTVKLWDAGTGTTLLTFRGHRGSVHSVAYSPDGSEVASGSFDRTIRVWDAETGDELLVLRGHDGPVDAVSFSPDGAQLASHSSDGTVRVWSAHTDAGQPRSRLRTDLTRHIAFTPDCMRFAKDSPDRQIEVWDARTGDVVLTLSGDQLTALDCTPDGTRLAAASFDRKCRIWDMVTGELVRVLKVDDGRIHAVALSPDGRRLAAAVTANGIRIWDLSTEEAPVKLSGKQRSTMSLTFSPDGARLASAGSFGARKNAVSLWDVGLGEELLVLSGHGGLIRQVAFSADGDRLATASDDGTIRLWDTRTDEVILILRGHDDAVTSVAFSPDRTRVASGSTDHSVRLWDTATGDEVLVIRDHTSPVIFVSFSADGTLLASASTDGTIRIRSAPVGD